MSAAQPSFELQPDLFAAPACAPAQAFPEGFRYAVERITPAEESLLVAHCGGLSLEPYEFRGYLAHRKVAAFGYRYDYGSYRVERAPDIPPFLLALREKAAAFAQIPAEAFRQIMVTEYPPGTAIGWHRDRPQYGQVVGLSLLSAAAFRLRRHAGEGWERAALLVRPRSMYLLSGDARWAWEHSIPPVRELRYSVTFRTLSEKFKEPEAAAGGLGRSRPAVRGSHPR